jgi:RNA polymerase sigma factor (sigma-70 family)
MTARQKASVTALFASVPKAGAVDPVLRRRAVFLLGQMKSEDVPDIVRQSAREELCEMFERLAFHFGRRYLQSAKDRVLGVPRSFDNDDVRAECLAALVQALNYWNPEKGDITTALRPLVAVRLRRMLRSCETIKRPMSTFVSHYQAGLEGDEAKAEETAPVVVSSIEWISQNGDAREREFGDPTEPMDREIILKLCVREALGRLPERQRQAVALFHGFDGYEPHSLRQAAAVMGCSHQWVRDLLERATVQLQGSLAAFA